MYQEREMDNVKVTNRAKRKQQLRTLSKTAQIYCFPLPKRNISEMANKIKTKQNRMKRRMSAAKKNYRRELNDCV